MQHFANLFLRDRQIPLPSGIGGAGLVNGFADRRGAVIMPQRVCKTALVARYVAQPQHRPVLALRLLGGERFCDALLECRLGNAREASIARRVRIVVPHLGIRRIEARCALVVSHGLVSVATPCQQGEITRAPCCLPASRRCPAKVSDALGLRNLALIGLEGRLECHPATGNVASGDQSPRLLTNGIGTGTETAKCLLQLRDSALPLLAGVSFASNSLLFGQQFAHSRGLTRQAIVLDRKRSDARITNTAGAGKAVGGCLTTHDFARYLRVTGLFLCRLVGYARHLVHHLLEIDVRVCFQGSKQCRSEWRMRIRQTVERLLAELCGGDEQQAAPVARLNLLERELLGIL